VRGVLFACVEDVRSLSTFSVLLDEPSVPEKQSVGRERERERERENKPDPPSDAHI